GSEDFCLASFNHNRHYPGVKDMMGMFVSTFPIRIQPEPLQSFSRLVENVGTRSNTIVKNHVKYPLDILVGELMEKTGTDISYLLDIAVLVLTPREEKEYSVRRYYQGDDVSPLTLRIDPYYNDAHGLLEAQWNFHVERFTAEDVRRFHRGLTTILAHALAEPESEICRTPLLTATEKEEILQSFNTPAVEGGYYGSGKPIQQLLKDQSERTPHAVALVGPSLEADLKGNVVSLGYEELDRRSDDLAGRLTGHGIVAGDIIAVSLAPSLEMIIALCAILKSGAAYLPIDPQAPQERREYILTDSNTGILITAPESTQQNPSDSSGSGSPEHIPTETAVQIKALGNPNPAPRGGVWTPEACYIIYTSGTTGRPKGVVVEHRNILAYMDAFFVQFSLGETDTVIQQASFTFDAFVEEMYPVLLRGGKLAIARRDEVMDIDLLSAFIARHRVSMITCSPLLLNALNDGELELLRSLRIIISGGDVLKKSHIDKLMEFTSVFNTYGPTETTVCAAYYQCSPANGIDVPIGRPISGYQLMVTDSYGQLLPKRTPGQLCTAGPGVAAGYLNLPEMTSSAFGTRDRLYKTGDLVEWLDDGNISFLGRIDSQVKIRGFRIEPGEIEEKLKQHHYIKNAVVIDITETNETYLNAYIIPQPGTTPAPQQLKEYLALSLPPYMIPSHFVVIDTIPLTPSGKLNRRLLPQPQATGDSLVIPPRTETEKTLETIFADVLAVEKDSIGIDGNFFQLGGHSLKATVAVSKIHRQLSVKIPISRLFETPTIRALAEFIGQSAPGKYDAIVAVEKREYYPLSSAQKRMHFLQDMNPESIAYNIPLALPLGKDVDKDKLEAALQQLIRRHESLRTCFVDIAGQTVQRVHETVEFQIEYIEQINVPDPPALGVKGEPPPCGVQGQRPLPPEASLHAVRPFDLTRAPLLRSALLKADDGSYTWFVDIHHIISDGTSHSILADDFGALYQGVSLPALPLHYKDFSQWQNRNFAGGEIEKQQEYWLGVLADARDIPRLSMPVDFKRPEVFTFSGARHAFGIEGETARDFKSLARRCGGTLYMNVMAALNLLLYKYTGQEDILVGSGIAGRPHADLQRIIGMFINNLVLRNKPQQEKTYEGFLKEVIDHSIRAFDNQDVQFEELVEKLDLERDPSRNPLFDISLVVQNFGVGGMSTLRPSAAGPEAQAPPDNNQDGKRIAGGTAMKDSAKLDLTFYIYESDEVVYFDIEYYTGIFKQETIQRLISHFKNIVRAVGDTPSIRLRDIDILSDAEKQQVLRQFNDTSEEFPADMTIRQMFHEQAERTPDNPALVYREHIMTYRRLNRFAGQIAHLLFHQRHVRRHKPVGLLMSQSLYRPAAVLGILKAGAVYVPMDPALPEERLRFMLEDACIDTVISEKKYRETLDNLKSNCAAVSGYLCIDDTGITIQDDKTYSVPFPSHEDIPSYGEEHELPLYNAPLSPGSPAYIIYTSGTTGRPKGVMLEHRGIVSLDILHTRVFAIRPGDHVLQFANISFDVSVWEIFMALLKGAALHMPDRETIDDPMLFAEYMRSRGITFAVFPPPYAGTLDMTRFPALRKLITGGSAPSLQQVVEWSANFDYVNGYGPTESSICSTVWQAKENRAAWPVSIGRPVANTRIYILKNNVEVQPVGVAGEMCLAGTGLALGYLNNPELTAEKFMPAPAEISAQMPSPSENESARAGAAELLYKTGDLARWLPDGNIHFLGRIDLQVKIRG
ncbi:MAG: amino acid adenylation domain-containing protein, partial [bacterium]|nr:amino acid adenylation domain-containing protein [bacterium]